MTNHTPQYLSAAIDRIKELEVENALLREYHASCERFFSQYRPDAFRDEATFVAILAAREALSVYDIKL